MSYSNGVVSAPVSMQDVCDALGLSISSNISLKNICQSSKINPWSRRKPVSSSNPDVLEESDFKNVAYGLNVSGGIGRLFTQIDVSNVWGDYPAGYNIPSTNFRLTDFDSYRPSAKGLMELRKESGKGGKDEFFYSTYHKTVDNVNQNGCITVNNSLNLPSSPRYVKLDYVITINEQEHNRFKLFDMTNMSSGLTSGINSMKFDLMEVGSSGDTHVPTDDLTMTDIGLDSLAVYNNYTIAYIVKVGGQNYLFNTRLLMSDITSSTDKQTTVNVRYNNVNVEFILAAKTAGVLQIYFYPCLFCENVTYISGAQTYALTTDNNPFSAANVGNINLRLCLMPKTTSTAYSDCYFRKLTSSESTPLYSLDFIKTDRVATLEKYITTSAITSDILRNPYFSQSQTTDISHSDPYGFIMSVKDYATYKQNYAIADGADNMYIFDIVPILKDLHSRSLDVGLNLHEYISGTTQSGDGNAYPTIDPWYEIAKYLRRTNYNINTSNLGITVINHVDGTSMTIPRTFSASNMKVSFDIEYQFNFVSPGWGYGLKLIDDNGHEVTDFYGYSSILFPSVESFDNDSYKISLHLDGEFKIYKLSSEAFSSDVSTNFPNNTLPSNRNYIEYFSCNFYTSDKNFYISDTNWMGKLQMRLSEDNFISSSVTIKIHMKTHRWVSENSYVTNDEVLSTITKNFTDIFTNI